MAKNDYSIPHSNNTNAGTAKIWVKGERNYLESTRETNFKIVSKAVIRCIENTTS